MFTTAKKYGSRNLLKSMKIWILVSTSGMLLLVIIILTSDSERKSFNSQHRLQEIPNVMQWYNYTEGFIDSEEMLVKYSRISSNVFLINNELCNILDGNNIAMDDPKTIKNLLNHFLLPPPVSGPNHVYHLANPRIQDTSMGQSEKIRNILQNRKNGFFIECGALDGETRSNTLYMERFLNWTGLLIEADPLNFAQMIQKNRHAWLSPTCLSKTPHPQIVSFKQDFNIGRISTNKAGEQHPGHVDVQCFPIYSYLLALNVTHVDYFSLDVEGDELEILKTLPFDKVNIETLSVEFAHVNDGKDILRDFMQSKGYSVIAEVTHPDWLANDFIFVKNS